MSKERQIRESLRVRPANPEMLLALAKYHLDVGDPIEAVRLLNQAVACRPGFGLAYDLLATTCIRIGRAHVARDVYRCWAEDISGPLDRLVVTGNTVLDKYIEHYRCTSTRRAPSG